VEQNIDLETEVASGSDGAGVNVWIDAVRVRQILANLLSNAVKFTREGRVKLEWGIETDGAKGSVHFCVTDTGIGIPQDRLEAIFDSFTQANAAIHSSYGGTGLGLAVSKRLAELMGGSITVASNEGFGTEFRVDIPVLVTALSAAAPISASDAERRDFSGSRVLLVEDNPVNVKVALKMLTRAGCLVEVAVNGIDAAKMAAEGDYDLMLMDVMMPVCNGLEATRKIRARESRHNHPHTPIVALTASAFQGDRDACMAAGMDGFLAKPFTFDQLRRVLETWLPIADPARVAA
jgi:CheY-like chemotaxis protein